MTTDTLLPLPGRRLLLGGALLAPLAQAASIGGQEPAQAARAPAPGSARSEHQRVADLGDGRYLNPVLAGDRPDPTVVKAGADYYMTHSSFEANPGLLIWHSRDLVNWQPIATALHTYLGSVWAPELIHHGGLFYLYVPTKHPKGPKGNDIWVLTARDIRGPWSQPVPLGIDKIDPGHAVDEQGRRVLFLNGGYRVRLSDDGLRTAGPLEHVYDSWQYPEDWDVESHSQEGPKLMRYGGWWHMTLAVGGTAGPVTGHMVISARARTLDGPWEDSPHNPIVRTQNKAEPWWSRGHATLVEGPTAGDWHMVYHGYENGYWTLGRQTLLAPVEWTADGWYRARPGSGDAGGPLPKPAGGHAVPHGMAVSDDFQAPRLGPQWSFFRGDAQDTQRLQVGAGVLTLQGRGTSPANSAALCCAVGDRSYRVEVDLDWDEGTQAGLVLLYNDKLYAGIGMDLRGFVLHRYGQDQRRGQHAGGRRDVRALRVRLTNREHVLTLHTSADGGSTWQKYGTQMEVSGYHHNVAGGFMALRPALYAAGTGALRCRHWRYTALA